MEMEMETKKRSQSLMIRGEILLCAGKQGAALSSRANALARQADRPGGVKRPRALCLLLRLSALANLLSISFL